MTSAAELYQRIRELNRDLTGAQRDLQQERWAQAGPPERLDDGIEALRNASGFLDQALTATGHVPERVYGVEADRRSYLSVLAYLVAAVAVLLVTGRGLAGVLIAGVVGIVALIVVSEVLLSRTNRDALLRVARPVDLAEHRAELDRIIEAADAPEVAEKLRHARTWLDYYTQ